MTARKKPIIENKLSADIKDLRFINEGIYLSNEFEKSNPAFNYALNKAKRAIESRLKEHDKNMAPGKKFQEYLEKRRSICEKHAEKTKDSKEKEIPKIEKPVENALSVDYIIDPKKQKEFNEKISQLEKQYKDVILARKEYLDKEEEILSLKRNIEIYKVLPEYVPEGISVGLMVAIYPLISSKKPGKSLKTITLSKEKVMSVNNLMSVLMNFKEPSVFVEKMAYNFWAIKEKAEKIQEEKPQKDIVQLYKEAEELRRAHSKTFNHNGEPILYTDEKKNFYLIDDHDAFNEKLSKLNNDNKDVIEKHNEWSKEEVQIKGYTLTFDELPDMSRESSEILMEFISV